MKRNQHEAGRTFVADFETTVYKNQAHTEVWAAAMVEMFTENVMIYHSISEFFQTLIDMNCNIDIYFHNLKFDGGFCVFIFIRCYAYFGFFFDFFCDFVGYSAVCCSASICWNFNSFSPVIEI